MTLERRQHWSRCVGSTKSRVVPTSRWFGLAMEGGEQSWQLGQGGHWEA